MKRFEFPLQPIRVLREQRERLAQQRYSEALRVCEEAAYQLQAASEELALGWKALCDELAAGAVATRLIRTRAWCSVLEARQKERDTALKAARQSMNTTWREMMVATRDREAMDRYHDKCRLEYDRELQREDRKSLDELGLRISINGGTLSSRRTRL
jgi:flagellar export protein FliJ